ncbi:hypothetical protein GGQ86_000227 [Xanthobacter flavus]|uniref:DUF4336 domain-containing protein n=1 Tax=Xanthobacter flavus TaxID=281 RepID=A0A9W6FLK1_XANFL|nr:DUF4336 domain-containing protein [Xanthobacter flavus]MBN8917677.1 DUF4336 domain-containing protein [Hyphomicrobiales bacterium]MDR6331780.1 hypothetical protein [Xanthobacter flavus]GLI22427.1 hypothetical protein XFLAVUS301_21010 [Xanthobacter flavus]
MTALQAFGPNLWIADGPVVTAGAGFHYPTRTVVVRLAEGSLFIWSPVALSDALRRAVEALGPVRYLIAPNTLHDRFLGQWQVAYPAARIHAAPGLRQRRPDLDMAVELGEEPPSDWAADIDQVPMRGNLITTEVVFFHRPSATLLVTDLIQHFAPTWFTGWRAWVARIDLMTAPEPEVPRKFRVAFVDRDAARRGLERILGWQIERVVMAHGEPIHANGHASVRRAFRWLA